MFSVTVAAAVVFSAVLVGTVVAAATDCGGVCRNGGSSGVEGLVNGGGGSYRCLYLPLLLLLSMLPPLSLLASGY